MVRKQAEERARVFWDNPKETTGLQRLEAAVDLARSLPFGVNLWQVQNLSAQKLNGTFTEMRSLAEHGDEIAKKWVDHMTS